MGLLPDHRAPEAPICLLVMPAAAALRLLPFTRPTRWPSGSLNMPIVTWSMTSIGPITREPPRLSAVGVEALEPLPVLADHLEVHNRSAHLLLLSGAVWALASARLG